MLDGAFGLGTEFRSWLVGRAIRISDHMDYRMFKADISKPQVASKEGNNFQTHENAIGMNKGNCPMGLAAMDSQVSSHKLQFGKVPVKGRKFNLAAGDALQFGNNLLPHQRIELRTGEIPAGGDEQKNKAQTHQGQDQRSGARTSGQRRRLAFAGHHRTATPSSSALGTRMRPCWRRSRIHAFRSSSMRCCASKSLILGETSASGTSCIPDFRN